MTNITSLLRLPNVLHERGVRKTQHYDDIKRGLFTSPIKIGKRASAWPAHEVAVINQARIAGKSNEEIKKLVVQLHTDRTQNGGVQ
ncbi:AlpA family transcriptional regulator [Methylobacter sp. BlB1]|uniref:helix-turn-helix transcriptional regulator n=1 Tax=Methylobacter sp. BlB1 TaxID=2785914 RepID=UPI001894EA76|nr:AlpA family phage regulatory protein [Methylobacter sp. BlB1]MBF6649530.1 AlpA family phage regulatory protein [Methylobacter sp. BlB1]